MTDLDHSHFMRLALDKGRAGAAAGNPAIGSVIVRDGTVIGAGHNTVESRCDPTNHAETVAIRHACGSLKTTELPGTTLYTTMEPCPMCLWAICISGIDRLVMGARLRDLQPLKVNYGSYSVETFLAMTEGRLDVVTGILSEECAELRRSQTS